MNSVIAYQIPRTDKLFSIYLLDIVKRSDRIYIDDFKLSLSQIS